MKSAMKNTKQAMAQEFVRSVLHDTFRQKATEKVVRQIADKLVKATDAEPHPDKKVA